MRTCKISLLYAYLENSILMTRIELLILSCLLELWIEHISFIYLWAAKTPPLDQTSNIRWNTVAIDQTPNGYKNSKQKGKMMYHDLSRILALQIPAILETALFTLGHVLVNNVITFSGNHMLSYHCWQVPPNRRHFGNLYKISIKQNLIY